MPGIQEVQRRLFALKRLVLVLESDLAGRAEAEISQLSALLQDPDFFRENCELIEDTPIEGDLIKYRVTRRFSNGCELYLKHSDINLENLQQVFLEQHAKHGLAEPIYHVYLNCETHRTRAVAQKGFNRNNNSQIESVVSEACVKQSIIEVTQQEEQASPEYLNGITVGSKLANGQVKTLSTDQIDVIYDEYLSLSPQSSDFRSGLLLGMKNGIIRKFGEIHLGWVW